MMRDLLGNTILPGTLLWWITKALPIRVARIEEPSKLVLELTIPLDAITEGVETQLADFLCIVNPEAERIVEGMLGGQRPQ